MITSCQTPNILVKSFTCQNIPLFSASASLIDQKLSENFIQGETSLNVTGPGILRMCSTIFWGKIWNVTSVTGVTGVTGLNIPRCDSPIFMMSRPSKDATKFAVCRLPLEYCLFNAYYTKSIKLLESNNTKNCQFSHTMVHTITSASLSPSTWTYRAFLNGRNECKEAPILADIYFHKEFLSVTFLRTVAFWHSFSGS